MQSFAHSKVGDMVQYAANYSQQVSGSISLLCN